MKKTVIYLVLTLALILTGNLPFAPADPGQLRPVETLLVSWGEGVTVTTDGGDRGRGSSWQAAVENLEERAPGRIFQGTVSFLLLEPGAEELLPEILAPDALNPGCGVCRVAGRADAEQAGIYLRSHQPEVDLRAIRAGERTLPVLLCTDGGYLIVQ